MSPRSGVLIVPNLGYPIYVNSALRRVGLRERKYQKTAVGGALDLLLRQGKNAEINLPPGTGKTLISQIVAVVWSNTVSAERSKVLFVLPTSALREQHHDYSEWWAAGAGLCSQIEVSSSWIRSKHVYHQKVAEDADLWFALPRVFSNAVESAHIPQLLLDRVGLVVVDEYDAFSMGVIWASGKRLRFTKDYAQFLEVLGKEERRFLLMSATPARSL